MRTPYFFASILIFSVISLTTAPTYADVTVELHGAYSTTPGLTLSSKVVNFLDSMTNATLYYKGNSVRYDSNEITEICNYSKDVVMTINNYHQTYFVTKRGIEQRKAFDRLFGFHGSSVRILKAHKSVEHIIYLGHKCLRTTQTEVFRYPSGAEVSFRGEEIDALDIKGFTPPRTPDGKPAEHGITLKTYYAIQGALGEVIAQTQATSISSARLTASTFAVGKNFRLASREEVVGSGDDNSSLEIPTGLMSDRAVDPYASLNPSTGFAKAQALVNARKFDQAATVARSLAARGVNTKLGPVYVALGDHAQQTGKRDEAWGWYNLVLSTDSDPADLVRAHMGLAAYYSADHDIADAQKQLGAILELPGATQDETDAATARLKQLTN